MYVSPFLTPHQCQEAVSSRNPNPNPSPNNPNPDPDPDPALGIPCILDSVIAELEKLGSKYRLALK